MLPGMGPTVLVSWFNGLAVCFHGLLVQWFNGFLVYWFVGFMV